MAAADHHQPHITEDEDSFAQRVEDLYDAITFEDGVDSESPGALVAAVETYLELEVTEAQITEALQEVAQSKENRLSKDEFIRFSEILRAQAPETAGTSSLAPVGTTGPDPPSSMRVDGDGDITTTAAAKRRHVDAGAASTAADSSSPERVADDSSVSTAPAKKKNCTQAVASKWAFEPRISVTSLKGDARVRAEMVYASVLPEMVDRIEEEVDTGLQMFLSKLPPSLSADVESNLRQTWLEDQYVTHVAAAVARCTEPRWVFKPALALEQVSEKERSRAANLYAQVDEAAAAKIEVEVATRIQDVTARLPPSLSAEMKEGISKAWFESNYVTTVSQVLNETPCSVSTSWTFSPLVKIESLPTDERAEAARMYALVNSSAASEIHAVVEKEFSAVLAPLSTTISPDAQAELRTAWLVKNYTGIVSRVMTKQLQTSAGGVGWTFAPAVPLSELPPEKRSRAATAYEAVTQTTEADILRATEEAWNTYQSSLGFVMTETLSASIRKEWLLNSYVDIVSKVVSSSPAGSRGLDATAHPSTQSLRGIARPLTGVDAAAHPIGQSPQGVNRPLATSGMPDTAEHQTSPRRRIRRRNKEANAATVLLHPRAELQPWCAADMHAAGSWRDDRWNTFTGEVIAADSAPRDAGGNGKKVFNAVLRDRTGVITVCAWGQLADDLAAKVNQLEKANEAPDSNTRWLRVELFSISQMRGSQPDICPIGAIQTIPPAKSKGNPAPTSSPRNPEVVDAAFGTQFTIVQEKDVKTEDPKAERRLASSTKGIIDFEVLAQLRPPFRVNITGVVVDVSTLQPTVGGSGRPIRTLTLSDPNGCQISIRQLGSTADDPEIQRQREVVAYFVSGTKAWNGGEAGSLWTYEDSYIKVVCDDASVPTYTKEVLILAS